MNEISTCLKKVEPKNVQEKSALLKVKVECQKRGRSGTTIMNN